MGSGWAALVWEPLGEQLLITQIYDHQSNLAQGGVPLLVIDAWEHAYYLQYQNRKDEFFQALWKLWNWSDIEQRYAEASKLAPGGAEPLLPALLRGGLIPDNSTKDVHVAVRP